MHERFARVVEALHPAYERLIAMAPIRNATFQGPIPTMGVYLFSEGESHLYVGRTNKLRRRYGHHCNEGSPQNQAAFAFKLAREATGRTSASYVSGADSRSGLIADDSFKKAFLAAKARIRRMDFRYVEETNQTRQALLELYCAIALGCRYNDFNTH